MVFLACSMDSNLSNKFCSAVALRGAHHKVFFHTVLAHTGNDATNFQGITDRLAALSFEDHDLPLESGDGIKEVTVKRRSQNLCQLPDHTRFAGRLVLVDQCSPSLKFLLLCWSGQFATLSLCRRESVRDTSLLHHFSARHSLQSSSRISNSCHCALISRSCLH